MYQKTTREAPTPEAVQKAAKDVAALNDSVQQQLLRLPHSEAWRTAKAAARMMRLRPTDARWQGAGCFHISASGASRRHAARGQSRGSLGCVSRWADAESVTELATAVLEAARACPADADVQEFAMEALAVLVEGPVLPPPMDEYPPREAEPLRRAAALAVASARLGGAEAIAACLRAHGREAVMLLNVGALMHALQQELTPREYESDVAQPLVRAGFAEAAAAALFSLVHMDAAWRPLEAAGGGGGDDAATTVSSDLPPPLPDWLSIYRSAAPSAAGGGGGDSAKPSPCLDTHPRWEHARTSFVPVLDLVTAGGPALQAAFRSVALRRPETVTAINLAVCKELEYWERFTGSGPKKRPQPGALPQHAGEVALACLSAAANILTKSPPKEAVPAWDAFLDVDGPQALTAVLRKLLAAPVVGQHELAAIIEGLRFARSLLSEPAAQDPQLLAEARAVALGFCFPSWRPKPGPDADEEWLFTARREACETAEALDKLLSPRADSDSDAKFYDSKGARQAFDDASRAVIGCFEEEGGEQHRSAALSGVAAAAVKVLRVLLVIIPPGSEAAARRAERAVESGLVDALCLVRCCCGGMPSSLLLWQLALPNNCAIRSRVKFSRPQCSPARPDSPWLMFFGAFAAGVPQRYRPGGRLVRAALARPEPCAHGWRHCPRSHHLGGPQRRRCRRRRPGRQQGGGARAAPGERAGPCRARGLREAPPAAVARRGRGQGEPRGGCAEPRRAGGARAGGAGGGAGESAEPR